MSRCSRLSACRLPSGLLVGCTLWLPVGLPLPRHLPPSLVYVQVVNEGSALAITVGTEVPPGTSIETFSSDRGRVAIGTVTGSGIAPFTMHDGGPLFPVDDETGKIIHLN